MRKNLCGFTQIFLHFSLPSVSNWSGILFFVSPRSKAKKIQAESTTTAFWSSGHAQMNLIICIA
jgi:hypothetical protein